MVCIPDGGPAMDETKLGHCMPNASKLCPQSLLGTLGMGGPPSLAQNRIPYPFTLRSLLSTMLPQSSQKSPAECATVSPADPVPGAR